MPPPDLFDSFELYATNRGGLSRFWVNIYHPGPGYIKHLKISASFLQMFPAFQRILLLYLCSLSLVNHLQLNTAQALFLKCILIEIGNFYTPLCSLNFITPVCLTDMYLKY